MKRRFVSVALCLLILVTAVVTAACTTNDTPGDTVVVDGTTSAKAMTISIWGVKGEGTTDEAIAQVEEAMSKLTETQYNTAIDLILLDEDEYAEKLEERMNEIQAIKDAEAEAEAARKKAEKEAKARGEKVTTAVTTDHADTADVTVLDEYNLPTTLYPEVEDDQLDIFLITDYDMLVKFNEMGVLSSLDDQLNGTAKLMKSYIHPSIISAGKMNNKTVAIINQQLVGDYTYMLVNKELLEKYYWDIDDFAALEDAYYFIRDVKRDEPDYQPIVGDLSPLNCNYFSPTGERTIFGSMIDPAAEYGDDFTPRIMFQFTRWNRYTKLYQNLKIYDCIGSETFTPEDKFGVGVMKGNANDIKPYEDEYHVVVLQAPQGTTENIFNGMFAVSTYTKNVARSMEVLTYINTRAEIRNLFGYGIEGVHYKLDSEGRLTKTSDDYNMKLEYTGNCFIAHAPEGNTMEYWDIAKVHNQNLVLSPFFKFEITEEDIDMELYRYTVALCEDFYAKLDLCTSEDEVTTLIDEYWGLCEDDEKVIEWLNAEPAVDENGVPETKTLAKFYMDWVAAKK